MCTGGSRPPSPTPRWRRLEGKDPETLELIQKINNLQKRLISKQEDLIDKVCNFTCFELTKNMLKRMLAQ